MSVISNFNEILNGFDKCAICRCLLELSFPKDFPEEWKFCCSCLAYAKVVVNRLDLGNNQFLLRTPKVKRIEKYITLVG